jgi:hypothetical protein
MGIVNDKGRYRQHREMPSAETCQAVLDATEIPSRSFPASGFRPPFRLQFDLVRRLRACRGREVHGEALIPSFCGQYHVLEEVSFTFDKPASMLPQMVGSRAATRKIVCVHS